MEPYRAVDACVDCAWVAVIAILCGATANSVGALVVDRATIVVVADVLVEGVNTIRCC